MNRVTNAYRSRIRWFFIGVAPLLLLLFMVSKFHDEPFPTLIYPAFGKAFIQTDGTLRWRVTTAYAYRGPQDSISVTYKDLFSGIRGETVVASYALKDYEQRSSKKEHSAQSEDFQRYLQRQLQTSISPGDYTHLRVFVYMDHRTLDSLLSHELVSIHEIPLH